MWFGHSPLTSAEEISNVDIFSSISFEHVLEDLYTQSSTCLRSLLQRKGVFHRMWCSDASRDEHGCAARAGTLDVVKQAGSFAPRRVTEFQAKVTERSCTCRNCLVGTGKRSKKGDNLLMLEEKSLIACIGVLLRKTSERAESF